MTRKTALPILVKVLLLAGFYALVLVFQYFYALPERYDVQIGMVSKVDITTQQDVEDRAKTEIRALEASSRVPQSMVRSPEIVTQVISRLDTFFEISDSIREQLLREASTLQGGNNPLPGIPPGAGEALVSVTPAVTQPAAKPVISDSALTAAAVKMVERLQTEQNVNFPENDAKTLLGLEDSIYLSVRRQSTELADLIMSEEMDNARLASTISQRVTVLVNSVEFFKSEYELVGRVLRIYLRPNLVYDEVATEAARKAEYDRVMNNPDIVPAGTRILSVGDTVTPEIYEQLEKLDLIEDDSVDWRLLGGLALLILMVMLLGIVYLSYYERQYKVTLTGDRVVLIASLLIPFIVSGYTTNISALAAPVYFASILIASYFGLRTGIVMSLLLIVAVLPMTYLNTGYFFTALAGSLLACYLAAAYRRRDSQVWMIVFTALGTGLAALTFGLIGSSNFTQIGTNVAVVTITAGLSTIGAIGIMPVFETIISSVSPITLIQLSQPSQPLLRRLFMEAPGTNQHSMMVANLSEAAAEAVGADGMLCRVGSYYHDIGKLENPEMFTENQDGFNIHDTMEPEDSVRYIIGHVAAGLKTAKRYRLPLPIQRIITEHHGNTLQASFYYAAKKKAEEQGLPLPNPEDYRYPWHVPSSKESGIVMLADSMEAAMKSTRTDNLEDAERLARQIAKGKIEQDQLVESGLSFKDIELIIKSFIQIYQGQFHERVRYPDESPRTESAAKVQQRSDRDNQSTSGSSTGISLEQN